jgi:GT2 family glycosyltransferase
MKPFSKGALLNAAIRSLSGHGYIVVTDVDIVWNYNALKCLQRSSRPGNFQFCGRVIESNASKVLTSPVFAVSIVSKRAVLEWGCDASRKDRPGYGIQSFDHDTFAKIGGYDNNFFGWGWEDVDIILVASALGFPIRRFGDLIHISHPPVGQVGANQDTRKAHIIERASYSIRKIDAMSQAVHFPFSKSIVEGLQ